MLFGVDRFHKSLQGKRTQRDRVLDLLINIPNADAGGIFKLLAKHQSQLSNSLNIYSVCIFSL